MTTLYTCVVHEDQCSPYADGVFRTQAEARDYAKHKCELLRAEAMDTDSVDAEDLTVEEQFENEVSLVRVDVGVLAIVYINQITSP